MNLGFQNDPGESGSGTLGLKPEVSKVPELWQIHQHYRPQPLHQRQEIQPRGLVTMWLHRKFSLLHHYSYLNYRNLIQLAYSCFHLVIKASKVTQSKMKKGHAQGN